MLKRQVRAAQRATTAGAALRAAAFCLLAAGCGGRNDADREEVVITVGGGTWEAAQRAAFFEPFTRETGIEVVTTPEDHSKLLASAKVGRPEADLTAIPGSHLAAFVRMATVEPIDYSYFSEETLAKIPAHLKAEHGVGSVVYSTVLAFNTEKFPPGADQPQTWSDLYDVSRFPGPRTLPKCEKMVDGGLLETALLADGVTPENIYPLDIDRAFAKLDTLRGDVSRWWSAGAEAPQSLIDGEVTVAAAYNGRIVAARGLGADIDMSWRQSLLQYDYWVVMSNAPNSENAMKFLAFVSQPEPQARFSEAISFGPTNLDAFTLVSDELQSALPGSPALAADQIVQNYDWWGAADETGRTNWERALDRCIADSAAGGR